MISVTVDECHSRMRHSDEEYTHIYEPYNGHNIYVYMKIKSNNGLLGDIHINAWEKDIF